MNWSLLSSSNSLLRRIRSPKDDNQRRDLHQCPGYLREEITLTCDLSKSVIVSHAFPGLSERCSICHQLVQYTCSESFDNFAPVGGIDPVNSSDASSVMGELFQPSPPSNEDIQSMQSMTDLNIYQDLDTGEPGMFCPILIPIHSAESTLGCHQIQAASPCPRHYLLVKVWESLVHKQNMSLMIGIESNEVPRLGGGNLIMIIPCLRYLLQLWTVIQDLRGYGIVLVCSG